jgi:uncharacterized integral membrane protein
MKRYFIIAIIIALLLVILVLQNTQVVTFTFFFWELKARLVTMLILTAAMGALISFILAWPPKQELRKEMKTMNEKIRLLNEQLKTPASPPSQP